MSDYLREAISIENFDQDPDEFIQPLVSEQDLLDKFSAMINYLGDGKMSSSELATNLIEDMSDATLYPLETIEPSVASEIARNIEEMLDSIVWT